MYKLICGAILVASLTLTSCSSPDSNFSKDKTRFAHEESDLSVDRAITYGVLDNGLRYAVRSNKTPSKTASLLMRIDTGSINERDETRGLAHFLEHMAFNGSENIAEDEMIKKLERYGLSFGADTNASTSFYETTYQLELPEVDENLIDETLMIMRETADNLLLAPEAIERERGVILAEKRARSSPAYDAFLDSLDFYLDETLIPNRLPIGTERTIQTVTAEQFREFYEGYYRPENTFIVFVGDFEKEFAVKKITEYFADWKVGGEASPKIELGKLPQKPKRVRHYTNPEIQTSLSLSTIQDYVEKTDNKANRRQAYVEAVGNRILSQRLGELSRTTDAPFISASAGTSSLFDMARISSLSIRPEKGQWDKALKGAEPLLRQALEFGFSQSELDEQIANTRKSLEVSVQTAPTRRTPSLARSIMGAFSANSVVTTPKDGLTRFNAYADTITVEEVHHAFIEQWKGIGSAPQLYLAGPDVIEDAEFKLNQSLTEARALPIYARDNDTKLEFAYSHWGSASKVLSREKVEDIDFEKIIFENGVKLNVKQTPYQKDVISISVAMGGGQLFMPKEEPGLRVFASNALNLGGLEAHKVDDIRKLMAGKSVGVSQSFGADRFYLNGATVPEDLDEQLNLMAAYATSPGFRPEAKSQYDKYIKSFYPTLDSTPGGVASRDVERLIRSGDTRFGFPSEAEMLRVDMDMMKNYMNPFLLDSAIEIGIVGDITPERAIEAVARSFGALPQRKSVFPKVAPEELKVRFPTGEDRYVELTHAGDKDTALLRVYWKAPDGSLAKTSREVSMLSTLMRLRLTEVLREEEGASYSPSAFSYTPRIYPDYGYMGVSIEVSPKDISRISEKVDEIAQELRAGEISDDLFNRAITPVIENIETSLESNRYWMQIISEAQTDKERLERHRSRNVAYQNMTVEDLKSRSKTLFSPETSFRIHIIPD